MADKRIVMVPFVYRATATKPKHRKPVEVRIGDVVPVEAAVLSSEEAPVVLRSRRDVAWPDKGFEMRAVEGRLFGTVESPKRAVKDGTVKGRAMPLPAAFDLQAWDDTVAGLMSGRELFGMGNYPLSGFMRRADTHADFTPIDLLLDAKWKVDDSNRATARDRAAEHAVGAFALIDGVLHVREQEPLLHVYRSSEGNYPNTVYRSTLGVRRASFEADAAAFRIDRIDEARAWAQTNSIENGWALVDHLDNRGFWASPEHCWCRDDDRDAALVWGRKVEALLRDRGTDVLTAGEDLTAAYLELVRDLKSPHTSLASFDSLIRRIEDLVDLHQPRLETTTLKERLEMQSRAFHKRIRCYGFSSPSIPSPRELDGFDLPLP